MQHVYSPIPTSCGTPFLYILTLFDLSPVRSNFTQIDEDHRSVHCTSPYFRIQQQCIRCTEYTVATECTLGTVVYTCALLRGTISNRGVTLPEWVNEVTKVQYTTTHQQSTLSGSRAFTICRCHLRCCGVSMQNKENVTRSITIIYIYFFSFLFFSQCFV